jgi:hypothetical protein
MFLRKNTLARSTAAPKDAVIWTEALPEEHRQSAVSRTAALKFERNLKLGGLEK